MAPRLYRGFGPSYLSHLSFAKARFSADFVRPSGPAPDAAALAKEPFVGITTDGHPVPGLFSLEGPGAPTKGISLSRPPCP